MEYYDEDFMNNYDLIMKLEVQIDDTYEGEYDK